LDGMARNCVSYAVSGHSVLTLLLSFFLFCSYAVSGHSGLIRHFQFQLLPGRT
jgi:hypothetical protein